jgi:hypothetical protein
MSEGDTWLHKAVYEVSLLLRDVSLPPAHTSPTAPVHAGDGRRSQPVRGAEAMVRQFCTKELKGASGAGGVGGVEEYIANAALDLVIMGVWSLAATQMGVEGLPVSLPVYPCSGFRHGAYPV